VSAALSAIFCKSTELVVSITTKLLSYITRKSSVEPNIPALELADISLSSPLLLVKE